MKNLNLNLLKKSALFITTAAVVILSACTKEKVNVPQVKTIAGIVVGDSNFTLLKTALVRADLATVLDGTGTFTVFAPNNAAFAAAGLETEAKINAVPVATLRGILLYHVLGTKVVSSAIATASNTAVPSLAEKNVFVTKNSAGVFINGATVVQADVNASNGVIHVINTVLMPPSGNIVETAQGNPNFTYLVAAVVRANLAGTLSGAGPFTVFAPTNQAFIAAGFPTIAAIQAASPATLTSILTYHVVAGRVFSSDLSEGLKPATVNGATVTITLNGGAKVKGNTNTTASTIAQANLVTTNGVIHVIDQVLLP